MSKIVQILIEPESATHASALLGLGDDGAVYIYENHSQSWKMHARSRLFESRPVDDEGEVLRVTDKVGREWKIVPQYGHPGAVHAFTGNDSDGAYFGRGESTECFPDEVLRMIAVVEAGWHGKRPDGRVLSTDSFDETRPVDAAGGEDGRCAECNGTGNATFHPDDKCHACASIFGTPPDLIPEGAEEFVSDGKFRALRFERPRLGPVEVRVEGKTGWHVRHRFPGHETMIGWFGTHEEWLPHRWIAYWLPRADEPIERTGEYELTDQDFAAMADDSLDCGCGDATCGGCEDNIEETGLDGYEMTFTAGCFGVGLSRRGKNDPHVCFTVLVEDDGNWFPSSRGGSSAWLPGLGICIQNALDWLSKNADGGEYGWTFRSGDTTPEQPSPVDKDSLTASEARAPDATVQTISEELERGGPWLGAAREWAKWHVRGGDSLQWDSREDVRIPFAELWEMARNVAEAAIIDERKARARETLDIRDRWKLEQQVERLQSEVTRLTDAEKELKAHIAEDHAEKHRLRRWAMLGDMLRAKLGKVFAYGNGHTEKACDDVRELLIEFKPDTLPESGEGQ